MAATVELIIGGLQLLFGSPQMLGYIIAFAFMVGFLMFRMPLMAAFAMIVPLVFGLVTAGMLPLWFKAVVLIITGIILAFIIGELIKR